MEYKFKTGKMIIFNNGEITLFKHDEIYHFGFCNYKNCNTNYNSNEKWKKEHFKINMPKCGCYYHTGCKNSIGVHQYEQCTQGNCKGKIIY